MDIAASPRGVAEDLRREKHSQVFSETYCEALWPVKQCFCELRSSLEELAAEECDRGTAGDSLLLAAETRVTDCSTRGIAARKLKLHINLIPKLLPNIQLKPAHTSRNLIHPRINSFFVASRPITGANQFCVKDSSRLFSHCWLVMDSMKDFGSCVETLTSVSDQRIGLTESHERVTAAIADGPRVLCGNETGDVFLVTIGADVIRLVSASPAKSVKQLAWVGKDRCISRHEQSLCRLWNLVEGREIAVFGGDRPEWDSETSFAVCTDGRVVTGSFGGNLRIWELEQFKQIHQVNAHSANILCICLIGEKCITGSSDNTVKVWTLNTLQPLATLQGHSDHVTCVVVASDGRCLSASLDRTVRIWDLSEYTEVGCYRGHQKPVHYLQEIDGGRCISRYDAKDSYDLDAEVRIWSLQDLSDLYHIEGMHWDQHKNVIYIGTHTGVAMLNLQTYEVIGIVDLIYRTNFVFYYEEKCACVSGGLMRIVEVGEYKEMREFCGHEGTVNGALLWGTDKLVSWSADTTLRVWDVSKNQQQAVLRGHSSEVKCAGITSTGRCISGDSEGFLKVWDLSDCSEVPTNMKHQCAVLRIALTSTKAISADEGGAIFVWHLDNYTKVGELQGHTKAISSIALASDEIAITGSLDYSMWVWNVNECKALNTMRGHWQEVVDVAAAGGNRCLSASADWKVHVYDWQKKNELPIILEGHTKKVWTVAVLGEKCVSGSEDCTIIVWNLSDYKEEAQFVCSAPVRQVVPIDASLLVSTHANGEVKVWDEYRELTTIKAHSGVVTSFTRLKDCLFASTGEGENTVKVWDLGQLSYSLSACGDLETLEREVSESKPLPGHFRSHIPAMKDGKRLPYPICNLLFRPYFINALHFCAYYNHPELLAKYLESGIPLVRGVCGSPLTLAIDRSTTECVDAILDFLISVAPQQSAWRSFETVVDDLLPLLESGSSKLEEFFGVLFQRTPQHLPSFITARVSLPYTVFARHPYVNESALFSNAFVNGGEDLVNYATSLITWNFIAGSKESIEMLTAAVNCEEKRVLLTDFFRTIIEQKWINCFLFTFSVALAYGAMLGCLMGTVNMGSEVMCIAYLALNVFFTLYEASQMLAMRSKYFTEGWNIVDSVRCTLSIVWAAALLAGLKTEKFFTLIVVLLDFIRGFTHFRSFRMTRIFVYMTFTVVTEVYSFLIILAYSIFAFGIFTSVLIGEQSLSETWKKAYNMAMGNFDTTDYGTLEWVVFTGATVTNVVIMMNLLISILGEAYEKAQMTMLENDLHMQASLLLEYETMMVWRRHAVSKTWIVTCRKADGGGDQLEWSGKVLQIVNSLTSGLSRVETEIVGKVGNVESRVKEIDVKIAAIEAKVALFDQQVASVEEIKSKVAGIEDLKTKVVGIENKVDGLAEKLDTVLGFLQTRS